jgi:hypothetical protein
LPAYRPGLIKFMLKMKIGHDMQTIAQIGPLA